MLSFVSSLISQEVCLLTWLFNRIYHLKCNTVFLKCALVIRNSAWFLNTLYWTFFLSGVLPGSMTALSWTFASFVRISSSFVKCVIQFAAWLSESVFLSMLRLTGAMPDSLPAILVSLFGFYHLEFNAVFLIWFISQDLCMFPWLH